MLSSIIGSKIIAPIWAILKTNWAFTGFCSFMAMGLIIFDFKLDRWGGKIWGWLKKYGLGLLLLVLILIGLVIWAIKNPNIPNDIAQATSAYLLSLFRGFPTNMSDVTERLVDKPNQNTQAREAFFY